MNNIFDRIKETANKRGLPLTEVSQRAGIGKTSIYHWQRMRPTAENLQKVADVLGVTTDYLLGQSVSEEKSSTQPADHQPKKYQDLDDKNTVMLYGGQVLTDDELAVIKSVLTAYRNEKRGE